MCSDLVWGAIGSSFAVILPDMLTFLCYVHQRRLGVLFVKEQGLKKRCSFRVPRPSFWGRGIFLQDCRHDSSGIGELTNTRLKKLAQLNRNSLPDARRSLQKREIFAFRKIGKETYDYQFLEPFGDLKPEPDSALDLTVWAVPTPHDVLFRATSTRPWRPR
jgi:hypothetical protein